MRNYKQVVLRIDNNVFDRIESNRDENSFNRSEMIRGAIMDTLRTLDAIEKHYLYMYSPPRGTGKRVSIKINHGLMDAIKQHAEDYGVSLNTFVNACLRIFIEGKTK